MFNLKSRTPYLVSKMLKGFERVFPIKRPKEQVVWVFLESSVCVLEIFLELIPLLIWLKRDSKRWVQIQSSKQGCGVHQNRAPHRCSAPVQKINFLMHRCKHRCKRENPPCTGVLAPENFCTTPAHRCIRVKCGAHRCTCTSIFQHHTSSPVHWREIWCTPVLTPVRTGAYNK